VPLAEALAEAVRNLMAQAVVVLRDKDLAAAPVLKLETAEAEAEAQEARAAITGLEARALHQILQAVLCNEHSAVLS
jgi:hypothetical protein